MLILVVGGSPLLPWCLLRHAHTSVGLAATGTEWILRTMNYKWWAHWLLYPWWYQHPEQLKLPHMTFLLPRESGCLCPILIAVLAPSHLPLWETVLWAPGSFMISTKALSVGRSIHGLSQPPHFIRPCCLSLGSPKADWETRSWVQVVDREVTSGSTREGAGRIRRWRTEQSQ